MSDLKSGSLLPVEEAIKAAIKALKTAPSVRVPALGDKVTSYDVVRHLEAALGRVQCVLDCVDVVEANWEQGDLAGAVNALCGAAEACRSDLVESSAPGELPWYTVVGHYPDTSQIFGHEVQARDGMNAFAAATAELGEDVEFTAAILGRPVEGKGIFYPGESVVDGETVNTQPEVFGTAGPTAEHDGHWAIGVVEKAGYRLVEAQEAEVCGRWDWRRNMEGSESSFETREAAAVDALEALAPFSDWQWEVQNGDTKRGYREWAEVKAKQEADEIAVLARGYM